MKKLFEKIKNFKHKKLYILAGVLILTILIVPKNVSANAVVEGLLNIGDIGLGVVTTFLKVIFETIMILCSSVLFLAGFVLDYSIKFTIVDFANITKDTGLVAVGWVVFRDLSNIVFIFLVLWIAISTVLGLSHDAPMASILRIAIAAILVNFSLFIGKAVIDVSNILSLHFYNLITGDGQGSFAGVFMSGMYLNTIYDIKGAGLPSGMADTKIIMIYSFGSIAMLIASWAFLAAAAMFIIRSLYLIILLILSPFAFIAWVVPGMGGMTHDWWNKLFKQAFFAPIFLIIIFIVGKALQTGGATNTFGVDVSGQTFTKVLSNIAESTPDTTVMSIVFNFFMIIGMIIAALMSSSKLGAVGAHTAIEWGNHIRGAGQSWIGGNAIGRPARWLNEKLEESYLGNTVAGKWFRDNVTTKAMHAKFGGEKSGEERYKESEELDSKRKEIEEIRGTGGLTGMGVSKGHNIISLTDQLKKQKNAYELAVRPLRDEENAAKAAYENVQYDANVPKATKDKLKKDYDDAKNKREEVDINSGNQIKKTTTDLQRIFGKLDPHAIAELLPEERLFDPEIIQNMTDAQMKAVLSSERMTEEKKQKVRAADNQAYIDAKKQVDEELKKYKPKYEKYLKDLDDFYAQNGDLLAHQIADQKVPDVSKELKLQMEDLILKKDDARTNGKVEEENYYDMEIRKLIDGYTSIDKNKEHLLENGVTDNSGNHIDIKIPKEPEKKNTIASVDNNLRNRIRASSNWRLDQLYRLDPDTALNSAFVMTARSSWTKHMRENEDVAMGDRDTVRDEKFDDYADAKELVNGLGEFKPSLDTFNNILRSLEKNGVTVSDEGYSDPDKFKHMEDREWEDFKKRKLAPAIKKLGTGSKYQDYLNEFNDEQKAMHTVGLKKQTIAMAGKSNDEFPIMRGWMWRSPDFARLMDRGMAKQFAGKDISDIKEVMDMVLSDFKRWQDTKGQFKMSRQNMDMLSWIVNDRDGRGFKNSAVIDPKLKPAFDKMLEVFKSVTQITEDEIKNIEKQF